MRRVWKRPVEKKDKQFLANDQIRSNEVFLIGIDGEQIGVTPTHKAISMAKENGFDLVEVNPTANPPVAKILDFGQFKYEKEKQGHKQKLQQKKVETKSVRLTLRISSHDFNLRLEQARKFLERGDKVSVELALKGREKQRMAYAEEIFNDFISQIQGSANFNIGFDQPLTKQGGKITIVLINKK